MAHPIINAFLDDGGHEVVLIERVKDGIREKRIPAQYTSFHREEAINKSTMRALKNSSSVTSIVPEEGGWLRIGWKNEYIRRQARYKFKDIGVDTYEGDVDPVLFHLIESKAKIAKPRRCYLDFEADSRVNLANKENMRVLSWAIVDHDTGQEFLGMLAEDTNEAEKVLLQELVDLLDNYDQICVWEGDWKGGEFDTVLFKARTRRRGIAVDERRWLFLNQLAVWRKMNLNTADSGAEKESFKLEDISHEQIGEGKEKAPSFVKEKFGDKPLGAIAYQLWEAGGKYRRLLGKYNVRDAQLLRKLELKKGFITLFQAVAEVCGIIPETRSLQPTRQMDGFIIRLGRQKKIRFSTKSFKEDDENEPQLEKFRGAVVFHPKSVPDDDGSWTVQQAAEWRLLHGFKNGILTNVHVCDFKSLYPSVMQTWNLSGDMVAGWCEEEDPIPEGHCRSPGNNLLTRTDELGYLPLALAELLRLRKHWSDLAATLPPGSPEWQDAMAISNAYKVTANAFYGGGGSKYSRFNNRDVSEATTQNSVYLLQLTATQAENRKMIPVYADTDSCFVIGPTEDGFRTFVNWLNGKYFPKKIAAFGCKDNHISLAFEKTFSRIVMVRAKSYCARYSQYKGTKAKADSEPEIKGLAFKRGDKGKLARELQGRIIDCLVGGVKVRIPSGEKVWINRDLNIETPTENLEIYYSIITKMRDHVLSGELAVEDVRQSRSIRKPLKDYGSKKKGAKDTVPAHVAVAKELVARGQVISPGMRVEYVVVDGQTSPQKIVPIEDYAGECDRFHLWERVYEPTKALLEAAFPDEDWESWGNVRPPKPKKRGTKVLDGQLGFFTSPRPTVTGKAQANLIDVNDNDLAVTAFSLTPLTIRIPESSGKKAIDRLMKVFQAHPGSRQVEVLIDLISGHQAVLGTKILVSTGTKFKEAVDKAIHGEAS